MDLWADHVNDHATALADTHLALTMVVAVGEKNFGRILESQHAYSEGANSTNSDVIEFVGRELCLGMIAFRRGDYVVRKQNWRCPRPDPPHWRFQRPT